MSAWLSIDTPPVHAEVGRQPDQRPSQDRGAHDDDAERT
jgi:hypothetical protein